VAVLAITRPGVALAARVAAALPVARLFVPNQWCAQAQAAAPGRVTCYSGGTSAQVSALFAEFTGIVAVLSLGAMVRLIAPHLRDKTHDPAVVVLDEAGRYAIPVLSGHLGGANALATHLAGILDAVPVLTTASDVQETLTVDLLGREFGWTLEASHQALLAASAAVVNHEPVALVQEVGSRHWWSGHANGRTRPLPDNIQVLPRIEDVDPSRIAALLWISQRPVEALPGRLCQAITDRLVVYRPPLEDSV
jgi:cobalt-precorrin 5A hydrolase